MSNIDTEFDATRLTLDNIKVACLVLHDADAAGLPMPATVSVTGFQTYVDLHINTLDDLNEWATHFGWAVGAGEPIGEYVHHHAGGEVSDYEVRLVALTDAEAVTA